MSTLLLWPLSLLYGVVIGLRNCLYDRGYRQKKAPCAVISVGNLTVGGTGKTPMVVYLAQLLQEQSIRVVILSRGYKGKRAHAEMCVSDGEKLLLGATEAGDEPRMMAELLPRVPVYVGKKRVRIAHKAFKEHRAQVCLLDDGFQHRALDRDMDVVLLDAHNPFGNGGLLPAGRLREPLRALKRADVVVLSKVEGLEASRVLALKATVSRVNPQATVVRARYTPVSCVDIKDKQEVLLADLQGKKVVLVSSIARPSSFEDLVGSLGVDVLGHYALRDHQPVTKCIYNLLFELVEKEQPDYVLTTHKDMVKWPLDYRCFISPLLFLNVKFKIEAEDLRLLNQRIDQCLLKHT